MGEGGAGGGGFIKAEFGHYPLSYWGTEIFVSL